LNRSVWNRVLRLKKYPRDLVWKTSENADKLSMTVIVIHFMIILYKQEVLTEFARVT